MTQEIAPGITIREIAAATMPEPVQHAPVDWRPLFENVKLRLEQTPRSRMLDIAFDDARLGNRAARALRGYASREIRQHAASEDWMEVHTRMDLSGTRHIYVRRGEGYGRQRTAHRNKAVV